MKTTPIKITEADVMTQTDSWLNTAEKIFSGKFPQLNWIRDEIELRKLNKRDKKRSECELYIDEV